MTMTPKCTAQTILTASVCLLTIAVFGQDATLPGEAERHAAVLPPRDTAIPEQEDKCAATNLAAYVAALDDDRFVSVAGQAMRRSEAAEAAILVVGEAALPLLRKALQEERPAIQARSVGLIYTICKRSGHIEEALPAFSRALSNDHVRVRQAAVIAIGRSGQSFEERGQTNSLNLVVRQMLPAMADPDRDVRVLAAAYLMKFSQEPLVPESLREAAAKAQHAWTP